MLRFFSFLRSTFATAVLTAAGVVNCIHGNAPGAVEIDVLDTPPGPCDAITADHREVAHEVDCAAADGFEVERWQRCHGKALGQRHGHGLAHGR